MVPIKTPAGITELGTRRLGLSQRHRTVLLLVDGKRTEAQVRWLATQAGAPAACFDELVGLALIAGSPVSGAASPAPAAMTVPGALPSDTAAVIPTTPSREAAANPPAGTLAAAKPLSPPGVVTSRAASRLVVVHDSLLPAAGTLPPDTSTLDSVIAARQAAESWPPPESEGDDDAPVDSVFTQARDMLARAVRSEAPWTGSLTLLKLRRARDRAELNELLDEVEARINRPHRSLAAAQLLTSVRQLLATHIDSSRSAA